MDSKFQILNALDPKCQDLEANGFEIVGQSWGAHLHLEEPIKLTLYSEKISMLQKLGFRVESLPIGLTEQVYDLEIANNSDYPYTPATAHERPTLESTKNLWKPGSWVFGAFKDDTLIGVVAATQGEDEVSIDFGSVKREVRGLGVASAILSLAIRTFANLGERQFSTGGAAINEASQATVKSLGFIVDEQWRSYQRLH